MGLGFIGVLKQAAHQYLMAHMQIKELNNRGDCYGLGLVDEGLPDIMKFVWVD